MPAIAECQLTDESLRDRLREQARSHRGTEPGSGLVHENRNQDDDRDRHTEEKKQYRAHDVLLELTDKVFGFDIHHRVTTATAVGGSEAGKERADQQGNEGPQ